MEEILLVPIVEPQKMEKNCVNLERNDETKEKMQEEAREGDLDGIRKMMDQYQDILDGYGSKMKKVRSELGSMRKDLTDLKKVFLVFNDLMTCMLHMPLLH